MCNPRILREGCTISISPCGRAMSYVFWGLTAFVIFSVGLNLGLHGIITLHDSSSAGLDSKPLVPSLRDRGASVGIIRQQSETSSRADGQGVGGKERVVEGEVVEERHSVDTSKSEARRDPVPPRPPRKVLTEKNGRIVPRKKSSSSLLVETTKSRDNDVKEERVKHQATSKSTNQFAERGHADHQVTSARSLVDTALEEPSYQSAVHAAFDRLGMEDHHIASRDDISSFVAGGGKIPIVMMTCNRAELLKRTLASLFSVNGVTKANVVVLQDGNNVEVATVVKEHGLKLDQHEPSVQYQRADGATRIAMHYKYALSRAFELFPNAPAVIVVEDDLLFSPDFLDYFEHVAPILDVDESAFLVSAWSDNGYKGKVDDPYALRRTEFFPGLGWLLPRRLYLGELEAKWPTAHWDHWLRSEPINRGREIIYPQVPRTFHNGIRGTFMDMGTHNRYFRDIAFNQNRLLSWRASHSQVSISGAAVSSGGEMGGVVPVYTQAIASVYEERVASLVRKCRHITRAEELVEAEGVLCLWLEVEPEGHFGAQPPFQPVAEFFGIWHEHQRGVHKGLHEFYFGQGAKQYILLLNVYPSSGAGGGGARRGRRQQGQETLALPSPGGGGASADAKGKLLARNYGYLKPADAVILSPREFNPDLKQRILDGYREAELAEAGATLVAAPRKDMSCDEVCSSQSKRCKPELLRLSNTCAALRSVFTCSGGCHDSVGAEQPAMVDESAPSGHAKGVCLYFSNIAASTCEAKHKYTRRACVCTQ